MIVEALGNPLCFTLTGGQCHDRTQAESLTIGFALASDYVIADRSYDADEFVQLIIELEAVPVS